MARYDSRVGLSEYLWYEMEGHVGLVRQAELARPDASARAAMKGSRTRGSQ